MNKLERELKKTLPSDLIFVNREKQLICYYDHKGLTTAVDQDIVANYLNQAVADQLGPFRITRWGSRRNGHYAHHYQRI